MRESHAPVRLIVALTLLLSLVAPLAVSPSARAQDVDEEIDLAAVALTSGDLEDAGFDEFGTGRSEMQDAWSFASLNANPDWYSGDEILDAVEDADYVRSHAIWFYDPPASDGSVSRMVLSSVTLFEDASGAEDIYDFFADVSDNDIAEPVDGWDDFGDDSAAYIVENDDTGVLQFNIIALVDNLVFMIANTEWEDDEFDERALEDLVDIAIDRIEIGLDAEQPALSNMVLRFATYYSQRDLYLWRDGFMNRFYDDDDEAVEWRIERRELANQIEHYQMSVELADFDEDDFDLEYWQYADVFRFEDEDAAEEWMSVRQDFLVENEFFVSIEFEDADVGDESFFYEGEGFDEQLNFYSYIAIRVGDVVIEHGYGGPESMMEIVEVTAVDQAVCLEDEGCLEPIRLPGEIDDMITAQAETQEAAEDDEPTDDEEERDEDEEVDEDEDDGGSVFPFGDGNDDDDEDEDDSGDSGNNDASNSDLERYDGQFFNFSVSYDPDVWTINADDDLTADGEEVVRFNHESAVQIFIIASEELDPDDLESCLFDAFDLYGWGGTGFDMDDAEDMEIDDDVASFVIPAVTSALGTVAGMSGECRAMNDAVLTIFSYLPGDEDGELPQASFAIAQELIATIEID